MRYFNGEIQVEANDITADGFGLAWGHTRKYSNRMGADYDYGNGYNWLVAQWPYLSPQGGLTPFPTPSSSSSSSGSPILVPVTIVVVRTSLDPLWFDFNGTRYVGRNGIVETLVYKPSSHQFVLTGALGTVTRFQDFTQKTAPQGLFLSQATAGGQVISVASYAGRNIGEVQRSFTSGGVNTVESFVYAYTGGDLQSVLSRRTVGGGGWTNIRQARYTYYGAGDPNGSVQDLRTAVIQAWNPTLGNWQTQKNYYYRYWVAPTPASSSSSSLSSSSSSSSSGSSGPYVANHLLKFVLNPAAYARMTDAGLDPLAASDAELAQFADLYCEYDSNRHATKEARGGGKYVYTLAYFTPQSISSSSSSPSSGSSSSGGSSSSSPPSPYNVWVMKAVETRPDGATLVNYTNKIGQVLVRDLSLGAQRWIEVQQFDANANMTLYARPSAVASYDETQPDLGIVLNSSSGLIELFDFVPGLPGRVRTVSLQNGTVATPVVLRQYQYTSYSAGGATVYPVTEIKQYRNDDGTGVVLTDYGYTFYPGTVAVQRRTTTLPVVSAAQHGSGVADTRVEYLDQWGNLTWEMGPRGFIMYMRIDVATGGTLERIDDFNTSLPGQPTPPAGWTTPAGGGLNLVTDFKIDDRGRETLSLGPSHTVDLGGVATVVRTAVFTVHQDSTLGGSASEVWTARAMPPATCQIMPTR